MGNRVKNWMCKENIPTFVEKILFNGQKKCTIGTGGKNIDLRGKKYDPGYGTRSPGMWWLNLRDVVAQSRDVVAQC